MFNLIGNGSGPVLDKSYHRIGLQPRVSEALSKEPNDWNRATRRVQPERESICDSPQVAEMGGRDGEDSNSAQMEQRRGQDWMVQGRRTGIRNQDGVRIPRMKNRQRRLFKPRLIGGSFWKGKGTRWWKSGSAL